MRRRFYRHIHPRKFSVLVIISLKDVESACDEQYIVLIIEHNT